MCKCGHAYGSHTHYRIGRDCGHADCACEWYSRDWLHSLRWFPLARRGVHHAA
jgi:hypothetical protein